MALEIQSMTKKNIVGIAAFTAMRWVVGTDSCQSPDQVTGQTLLKCSDPNNVLILTWDS